MAQDATAPSPFEEALPAAPAPTLLPDFFQGVSADRAQSYLSEAVEALAQEGLPERLRVLAHGLTTHPQRIRAFRLAMGIAQSSGKPSAAEVRVLDMLQATFGLADDEVERLRDEVS